MEIRTNNVVFFIKRNLAKFLYDKEESRNIRQVEKVLKSRDVDLTKIDGFDKLKETIQIIINRQRNAKAKANLINAACVAFIIKQNIKRFWMESKAVATLLLFLSFSFISCTVDEPILPDGCDYIKVYGVVEKAPFPDTTGVHGACVDVDDYEPLRIGSMSPDVGNVIGVNWNNEEFVYFSSAFYDFYEIDDSAIECTGDGVSYAHYRAALAVNDNRVSSLLFEPDIEFFDCALSQNEEYFFFEFYIKPKSTPDGSN